jgi:uncharacterized protein YndB with AHSA1/START domain
MSVSSEKSSALKVTLASDREFVLTRTFDAPRKLVFDAITKPEHVIHWYGPHGFTLPVCQIDLRPGGTWRFVMRKPDGKEIGMRGVYQEIAPPDRLVSTESFDDFPGETINTLTLVEENGKTTMTNVVLCPSSQMRDGILQSGMEKGAGETYDRLAGHLATMG